MTDLRGMEAHWRLTGCVPLVAHHPGDDVIEIGASTWTIEGAVTLREALANAIRDCRLDQKQRKQAAREKAAREKAILHRPCALCLSQPCVDELCTGCEHYIRDQRMWALHYIFGETYAQIAQRYDAKRAWAKGRIETANERLWHKWVYQYCHEKWFQRLLAAGAIEDNLTNFFPHTEDGATCSTGTRIDQWHEEGAA